jgi:uncharacterized membrane protein YkvA (DUF1232 family)
MSQNKLFGCDLPPGLHSALIDLAEGYQLIDRQDLKDSIHRHLNDMEVALRYNEFIDINTARKIAQTFDILMDELDQFGESDQAYIIGAARYFIREQDTVPDTKSILGLDDDVQVLNYVLDRVGLSEMKVTL